MKKWISIVLFKIPTYPKSMSRVYVKTMGFINKLKYSGIEIRIYPYFLLCSVLVVIQMCYGKIKIYT